MQGSGSLKIFCDSDTGTHWHSIPAIGDGSPSAHWHDSVLLDSLTFRVDFHINKVWRRDKYLLMRDSGAHPKSSLPSQRMNGGASPGKSIMSIISSCVRMSSPRPRSLFEVQETKRNETLSS